MEVSDVKYFEEQMKAQNDLQTKQYKDLEFKYIMLAKQYAKLQEQYHNVLKLAKENADSSEYCLRELEKDYEKATQKLVELGAYNV